MSRSSEEPWRDELPVAPTIPPAPLDLAASLSLGAVEAGCYGRALTALFGAAPPVGLAPLSPPEGGRILLGREQALDVLVSLLGAAEESMARGECLGTFALLGMESQLLERLIDAGPGRIAG